MKTILCNNTAANPRIRFKGTTIRLTYRSFYGERGPSMYHKTEVHTTKDILNTYENSTCWI